MKFSSKMLLISKVQILGNFYVNQKLKLTKNATKDI